MAVNNLYTSMALVSNSFFVTTSKALVTTSVALVPTIYFFIFGCSFVANFLDDDF